MKFLCLDIEAVRDTSLWTPPEPEPWVAVLEERRPTAGPAEVGERRVMSGVVQPPARDVFAPPFGWRPFVIGLVLLEETKAGLRVRRCGAIETSSEAARLAAPDAWEEDLLRRFGDVMSQLDFPDVVSWNGRRFDLPVLMLRSMRHGISHPWYYRGRDCRYRYSEGGHCDLADQMADHGATHHLGLDGMSKLIGLPGKFGDIDGAGVGSAFAAGRLAEITAYCMADAVSTAFLWLRWQLLKGDLGMPAYQRVAQELLEQCEADERLRPLAARVDERRLLLGPRLVEAPAPNSAPEAPPAPAPEAA